MNRDIYSWISLAQHDLEGLQGCSIYHISGQPIPVPQQTYYNFFSYIQTKSPLF